MKDKLQKLSEALQAKLLSLPHYSSVSDFTEQERVELAQVFGDSWPELLGIHS